MNAKLLKETEKSFVVEMGGKEITVAKTPGNSKMLEMLKSAGQRQGKDIFAGKVPGTPKVPGKNTIENDTVKMKSGQSLSPGEIVIPLESTGSLESAISFLKKTMAEKAEKGKTPLAMNQGGDVGGVHEYMFKGGKICYADGGPVVDPDEAKKAAESMRKAFNFYDGGEVADDGAPSQDEQNINAWKDLGSDVADGVSNGVSAVGNFISNNVPTPAENMRAMYGNQPSSPQPATGPATPPPADNMVMQNAQNPASDVVTGQEDSAPEGTQGVPRDTSQTGMHPNNVVDLNSSKTQTSGVQQKYLDAFNKTTDAYGNAKAAEFNAAASNLHEQAAAANLNAQRYQDQVQENQRVAAREHLKLDDQLQKGNDVRQKYLSMKVDPKHLWGDEGTGNRVMAGLGLLLGGFGQAFNGKDNPAIGIIDNALKRDLEIQKAQIEKAHGDVEMQDSLYAQMKDVYKDDRAAELATLSAMKDRAAMQLDILAKQGGSEQAKAQATSAQAQIKQSAAADLAKANTYTVTNETQQKPVKPNMMTPDEKKSYGDKVKLMNKLDEMMVIKKAVDTGKVDDKVQLVLKNLGFGNMDAEKLRAQSTEVLAHAAKTAFSRVTENELKLMGAVAPSNDDQDDVWVTKALSLRDSTSKDLDTDIQMMRDSGTQVPAPDRYITDPARKNAAYGFKGRSVTGK